MKIPEGWAMKGCKQMNLQMFIFNAYVSYNPVIGWNAYWLLSSYSICPTSITVWETIKEMPHVVMRIQYFAVLSAKTIKESNISAHYIIKSSTVGELWLASAAS